MLLVWLSVSFSVFLLSLPFIVLYVVAGTARAVSRPRRSGSLKDEIVKAQWEYDRTLRRRE